MKLFGQFLEEVFSETGFPVKRILGSPEILEHKKRAEAIAPQPFLRVFPK